VQSPGTGSPNLLLYSGFLVTSMPTPPSVTVLSPNGGERLSTDAPFTIRWSASDPDGLSRFDVMVSTDGVNYSAVCVGLAGSRRDCTWNSPAPVTTKGRIRVTASDTLGAIASDVSDAPFTITDGAPQGMLPAPWTSQDIGTVGAVGTATYSGGTFTVKGSGADVWGSADEFQYVHQRITGNFQVEGRVVSVQNVQAWTKAGLMIREGLAAGARHASIFATPGTTKPVSFQRRPGANGTSVSTPGPIHAPPVWLRLVRNGNVITASYRTSSAGAWTLVGQQSFSALSSTVDVGLAVSSHQDATLATGTFDSVRVTETVAFTSTDIGTVGIQGATTLSGSTVTISGGGADIWNTADAFRFYSQPWSGDGTITVRVRSVENVHPWTKAGVMFRESTAAGSKHIMLLVSPGRGLSVQSRTVTGGTSHEVTRAAGVAPEWLRIRRAGGAFSMSASEDGVTWRTLASSTLAMAGTLLVGLPVTSHDTSQLATAVFSDLSVAR
jgi:regulation of enolase protein 1 (concanavalin A-like superfamily)